MTPTDSIELNFFIARAHSEGRQKFGDLGLDVSVFARRIVAIARKYLGPAPSPEASLTFVNELHGGDLYLATACAQSSQENPTGCATRDCGDRSIAWKCLEAAYKGLICDLVRFMYRNSYARQDLADSVLADLFFPDRSGSSRIASYDGRSSLSTWLRVIVCNRVINAQRSRATANSTDLAPELPDRSAQNNIEATLRARRYRPALEDSMASACSSLTPRERLMLLWRYEDGLQLGQIARLLGIHQSNVTRQLERLQSKLRDEVETTLAAKHGLSRLAIRECLDDVVENPHHQVSILEFVKTTLGSYREAAHGSPDPASSNPSRALKRA
jgi:RNA polymerase sigma-70 factor